ncbi:MAG: DMT family transporter [bacterium]
MKQNRAYIYASMAVLLWSTIASAFKVSLRFLEFIPLLFYSSLISLLILFVISLIQGKLHLLKEINKKDIFSSALLGFLSPFLYYLILLKAYSILRAQEALTLNYTWAIMLVILSIPILKQKIGLKSVLAIIISFFGVVIIAMKGDLKGLNFTNPFGVGLAIGSSVIWAIFWIYNTKDKRDATIKLLLNFSFGSLYIFIIYILLFKITTSNIYGLLGAIYIGLFEMGIIFLLWLKALRLSETTAKIGNLIYLSPFISLIIINRIVGERIFLPTIIGLILIVVGIIIQQYKRKN